METDLHDASVVGMSLQGAPKATQLMLELVKESGEQIRCTFNGVVGFTLDSFWEQNVVLEVTMEAVEEARPERISRALAKTEQVEASRVGKIGETLHGKELKLFEIIPSRGLNGCIIARELLVTKLGRVK